MRTRVFNLLAAGFACVGITMFSGGISSIASAQYVANADFEDGSLTGWNKGSQTGSLAGGIITGQGTGVTLINSAVTFDAGPHGAVGSPNLGDGSPNPYYQPAVTAATWSFSPYGTYGVALQPNGNQQFDDALAALGISSTDETDLRGELTSQASASGYGSGNPTDASWITKTVSLEAGTTYTMSWNYTGTDYVPFNDGSITSLTPATSGATPNISVNNSGEQFALLGFTNPGTGDYSTGTFGSTGWQVSTYTVSESGDYVLGFAVFNLDDTALSPVLLVDSQPGSTQKNGEDFGAVAPNNPDAPTVPPTTTEPPVTEPPVTEPPATDPPTTEPPSTEPPVTDPPATDPPATEPPSTEPPVTEPPATDPPSTEPPVTDPPVVTTVPETTVPRPIPPTTTPEIEETTVPPLLSTTTTTPTPSTEAVGNPDPSIVNGDLPKTGSGTSQQASVGFWFIFAGFIFYLIGRAQRRSA